MGSQFQTFKTLIQYFSSFDKIRLNLHSLSVFDLINDSRKKMRIAHFSEQKRLEYSMKLLALFGYYPNFEKLLEFTQ